MFGLSIYCASLSEDEMKEEGLASLFTHLPHRCIVLLEDIDSAGIRRERASGDPDNADDHESDSRFDETLEKSEKSESSQDRLAQIVAERIARTADDNTNAIIKALAGNASRSEGKGTKSNISLAGLLNIIDGAASHEISFLDRIACSTSTNNQHRAES
jgi:chaperone BCS1